MMAYKETKKIKIVFVPSRSRIRLYKIAKALRISNRFELILICAEQFYEEELFKDIFTKVIFYKNSNWIDKFELYRKVLYKLGIYFGLNKMVNHIKEENPDLIHAFCEPYRPIVKILSKTNYPVIMSDGNDFSGISNGIENLGKRLKKEEKFCFENVSGLIYKGPIEVTNYYRQYGFQISAKELTWYDHADKDLFVNTGGLIDELSKEIHVVYTGTITTNPDVKYCYYLPLAKILAQQKIHFHIYANPYQYKTSSIYIELDKKEPFFHFHSSVEVYDLPSEISGYQFGLWIHASEPSNRTQASKMLTGIGNKLFTYLEAGLPTIVSKSRKYGVEVVEKNKIGFSIYDHDWVNMRKIIENIDYSKLKNQVIKNREDLSIQRNYQKLVDFYLEILDVD